MKVYTTKQVCTALGITYRQLEYWCRAGYVPSANYEEMRRGATRLFTEKEARVAFVVARLVQTGMRLEVASKCLKGIISRGRATVGEVEVRVDLKGFSHLRFPPAGKRGRPHKSGNRDVRS